MRKYLCPLLVIALALMVAGAWVAFPQTKNAVGPAVSSFCKSFATEAKNAWTRLFPSAEKAVVPDRLDGRDVSDAPYAASDTIGTELGAVANSADDPDPSTLTPEQRRQKYKELVEAANMRKHEVMRANLMKCPDGKEALKVTRAYHEKLDAMKKLEEKYGQTDDRVALARIELVALKEAVQVANDRYKAWKDAHPGETVDPLADKLYCDLIARSRFYRH